MNAIIVMVLCVTALGTVVCKDVLGGPHLPREVPWMVSLSSDKSNGKHFCGGSILDSTHILTAAQCVDRIDPKKDHLKARIGSLVLDSGGVQYDVVNIAFVPDSNLMAILCTGRDMWLDLNSPVPTGKVALPTGNTDLAPGTMVRVAGWGVNTTEGMTYSEKLQVVDIPIVGPEDCASAHSLPYIPYEFTCAGADFLSSCVGDIGSPLTLDDVQYGVAYGGSFPCTYAPGLFLDVAYIVDSINSNVQKKCFDDIDY